MKRRQVLQLASLPALGLSGIPLLEAAAAQGGVLNVIVQPEPPGLMLGMIANVPTHLVSGNIYEGLLRYDPDLKPMPNLATSWEMAPDGMSYTFHLKKGVVWHDGEPFDAKDVVFACDVFLRELHARARTVLKHVKSVEATDSHTVVFHLSEPYPAFIMAFDVGSMTMIPRHIYEGTDFKNNPKNNTPIGTGPLKFGEWQRGSFIKLVPNEKYHEAGVPSVEAVYFHIIPDAASRVAAYETGKVDVLPGGSVEYFDLPRIEKLPNTTITTKGWEYQGSSAYLWLNNRNSPLDNKFMRQAVMYALDREAMRDKAFFGYAVVAKSPFSSSVQYASNDVKQYPRDVNKAKELLKQAGYDGKPIRLLPLPYGETWQRLAEIAKQNLTEAGMNITMTATDVPGWNQRLSEWDYDIAFTYGSQLADPELGISRYYLTREIMKGSPWNNVEGYSNPELDKYFLDGAVEIDPKKRAELYLKAQQHIAEEVPIAWLFELVWPTVYRSNIKGLITSGVGLNDGIGRAVIEKS